MNGETIIELFEYAYDVCEDDSYDPSIDLNESEDYELNFDYIGSEADLDHLWQE